MDAIFFCNNYNWRLGAICVGRFTRFDQIRDFYKCGICSLFTRKYNFGVVPGWGICALFLSPTVGFLYERPALDRKTFATFPKQNDKCPRGDGWARFEFTEP